jgi:integrase
VIMASLHRRPRSKYWHAAWRDNTGKQHMRSTKETTRQKAMEVALGWNHAERNATSEAQTRKVLSEILQRNTGQALRTPNVRAFFKEWLDGKNGETKDRYTGIANAFLKFLGNRADSPLGQIGRGDVQSYIALVKARKVTGKTLELHLQALKSAFNTAQKLQYIDHSPANLISVTVEDGIERELFNETEAKLLIDAAEGEWKTLLRIGYYTALRLTKAATLKWEMVDLVKKTIFIKKPGKRGKPIIIPIHDKLFPFLDEIASTDQISGYLLPGLASEESGGKRGLSFAFKSIARKAGVDMREITRTNGHKFCRRTFHSLRHGLVSGLANKGVASEQRRAITGHKTDTSHARYTHLETETLRVAINQMPSIPD